MTWVNSDNSWITLFILVLLFSGVLKPNKKIPYLTPWLFFASFFQQNIGSFRCNTYFVLTCMILVFSFFRQLLVLFLIHTVSLSMFRCVASYCQTMVAGSVGGTMAFLVILLFGGFVIPRCKKLPYFHKFCIGNKRWVPISCKSMLCSTIKQAALTFTVCHIATAFLPNWLKWGFWLSPLSYAEIGLTGNEFLAPRWSKVHFGIRSLN